MVAEEVTEPSEQERRPMGAIAYTYGRYGFPVAGPAMVTAARVAR